MAHAAREQSHGEQSFDGGLRRVFGDANYLVLAKNRARGIQYNDPLFNNLMELDNSDRAVTDNNGHVEQQTIGFNQMACINHLKRENNNLMAKHATLVDTILLLRQQIKVKSEEKEVFYEKTVP